MNAEMGNDLRPYTHGVLILKRDSMLPHERQYLIGGELTLTTPESFLIMKLNFYWSSKNIMEELKDEFVSVNIPELSWFW